MDISKKEYSRISKKHSGKSKLYKTVPKAYLIGGFICMVGQFFLNLYKNTGLDDEQAAAFTSITLILISAVLTGFGLYERIAKHGGAGTLVPITGFANSVVSPAIEFKSEGFILGVGAKMFSIAGPVIVYGVVASVIYGFIYWLMQTI